MGFGTVLLITRFASKSKTSLNGTGGVPAM